MTLQNGQLNWIANFIWSIADDVLRDVYVRGKYRDVILPMTVIRRLAPPAGSSEPEELTEEVEPLEGEPMDLDIETLAGEIEE